MINTALRELLDGSKFFTWSLQLCGVNSRSLWNLCNIWNLVIWSIAGLVSRSAADIVVMLRYTSSGVVNSIPIIGAPFIISPFIYNYVDLCHLARVYLNFFAINWRYLIIGMKKICWWKLNPNFPNIVCVLNNITFITLSSCDKTAKITSDRCEKSLSF